MLNRPDVGLFVVLVSNISRAVTALNPPGTALEACWIQEWGLPVNSAAYNSPAVSSARGCRQKVQVTLAPTGKPHS
ncbi:hypothetical protein PGTUg99_010272 [Puccinia graminis f. sp. tritici]|uniref:Secreted protein n=1 Tax=Puccinia graminis f. sp. tritici TaxID=56615 RepID=A0A5B0RVZ0_PUCGR|nr:hypothetical protein PGTUg99_010272 [Puccinia graminis f. sp. tritici]